MECSCCKEEIKQGAKKCKACGEILAPGRRLKNLVGGFVGGGLSVFVSIASLGIAYLEYQGRVEAIEEKEIVEVEKEAAEDLLKRVPNDSLSAAVEEKIQQK